MSFILSSASTSSHALPHVLLKASPTSSSRYTPEPMAWVSALWRQTETAS